MLESTLDEIVRERPGIKSAASRHPEVKEWLAYSWKGDAIGDPIQRPPLQFLFNTHHGGGLIKVLTEPLPVLAAFFRVLRCPTRVARCLTVRSRGKLLANLLKERIDIGTSDLGRRRNELGFWRQ